MIQIENISDNITVSHSLIVLKGLISPICNFQNSQLCIKTDNVLQNEIKWPVVMGRFIAYINLNIGINIINLSCDDGIACRKLRIKYKPLSLPRFIRLVYIICKDDKDPKIQAPPGIENSLQSACNRIILAAQMLQLFMAESLNLQGFGRKTFMIESDNSGHPICHIFETSLTREEAQAMIERQLWFHFGCELMTTSNFPNKENCKFLAFLSCTEYHNPNGTIPSNHKDILQMTKGHVALGGGGLALLGSGCLYTWPCKIGEIIPCFTNRALIDKTQYMDDSAGRGEFWACYSTTLGAVCHELGHIFDLGHDPEGIMARGFDDMVYFFTVPELLKVNKEFKNCSNSSIDCDFIDDHSITWNWEKIFKEKRINTCKKYLLNASFIPSMNVEYQTNNEKGMRLTSTRLRQNFRDPFWHRSSAIILAFHRWMNDVAEEKSHIEMNRLKISSNKALKVLQVRNSEGCILYFKEFLDGKRFQIDLSETNLSVFTSEKFEDLTLIIGDENGYISKLNIFV